MIVMNLAQAAVSRLLKMAPRPICSKDLYNAAVGRLSRQVGRRTRRMQRFSTAADAADSDSSHSWNRSGNGPQEQPFSSIGFVSHGFQGRKRAGPLLVGRLPWLGTGFRSTQQAPFFVHSPPSFGILLGAFGERRVCPERNAGKRNLDDEALWTGRFLAGSV